MHVQPALLAQTAWRTGGTATTPLGKSTGNKPGQQQELQRRGISLSFRLWNLPRSTLRYQGVKSQQPTHSSKEIGVHSRHARAPLCVCICMRPVTAATAAVPATKPAARQQKQSQPGTNCCCTGNPKSSEDACVRCDHTTQRWVLFCARQRGVHNRQQGGRDTRHNSTHAASESRNSKMNYQPSQPTSLLTPTATQHSSLPPSLQPHRQQQQLDINTHARGRTDTSTQLDDAFCLALLSQTWPPHSNRAQHSTAHTACLVLHRRNRVQLPQLLPPHPTAMTSSAKLALPGCRNNHHRPPPLLLLLLKQKDEMP